MEARTQYAETGGGGSVATISRLVIFVGLLVAFALAAPGSTTATSLHEVKKLTASDARESQNFGESVALSGETAVVGASPDDSVDHQSPAGSAAYVFNQNEGGVNNWGEVKKLTGSDTVFADVYGRRVAISGDTALIGAVGHDEEGPGAGAAYVFQRGEGGPNNWGEVKKLTASDAETLDFFGFSVAISGDTVLIGAFGEDAGGANAGAAYVFRRDEGGPNNWGEVKKLTASDGQTLYRFGWSVAISDETAVVGRFDDADGSMPGAAYVFGRSQGGANNWGEVTKLTASDGEPNDIFGRSVAVNGDVVVVGASREVRTGISAGAAYVFQRNVGGENSWGEVTKLSAFDGREAEGFSGSLAVSGDTIVVGAEFSQRGGGFAAGAAYVFGRNRGGAGNWGEVTILTASDGEGADLFGSSVALSGDAAIVGARWEDAGGDEAGTVYVFDLMEAKSALTGDTNCDAAVNAIDVALILQFNAGLLGSLPCADGGDVNGDGSITTVDAALILQFTAGLLDSLPP